MSDLEFAMLWGILALVALAAVCSYEVGFWAGRKDMLDETHRLKERGDAARKVKP